jgi:hypothetical protein
VARPERRRIFLIASSLALATHAAHALDKQGSAHAGELGGGSGGASLSGSLSLGAAFYNPSYAARPDNSGHVLMRFAPHLDLDLIGERLSIPVDVNVFSDRDQSGLGKLRPSELDVISGLTSTWPLASWVGVELGVRGERDMPVDEKGLVQSYGDARLRLLYALSTLFPGLGRSLANGVVQGSFTYGWFALNSSYAARPDNSGLALFRYGTHFELVPFSNRIGLGVDLTSFTDRQRAALRPSEIDVAPELIARFSPFELTVVYERDMPVDQSGLVQQLALAYVGWSFDLGDRDEPAQAEPEAIHDDARYGRRRARISRR